jgi:GNAT superfamily N-acetyltransferase
MGNVVVRDGLPADIEAAVAVYLASNEARRGGRPTPPHHIERVRRNLSRPDAFLVVAEDTGSVVGMALAMQSRGGGGAGEPVPGLCFFSMVFVVPDRWGERIGGRLVDAVLATARSRGYDRVELWTHVDNHRSQRLYEGRGFIRSGREVDDDLGDRIFHYERRCAL